MKARFLKSYHRNTIFAMPFRLSVLLMIVLMLAGSCAYLTFPAAENAAGQYGIPFEYVPETADIVMDEINPLVFSGSNDIDRITPRLPFFISARAKINWSTNPDITAEYENLIRFRKKDRQ